MHLFIKPLLVAVFLIISSYGTYTAISNTSDSENTNNSRQPKTSTPTTLGTIQIKVVQERSESEPEKIQNPTKDDANLKSSQPNTSKKSSSE